MKRPPILVIVVSVLLIATGIGGSIQHRASILAAERDGLTLAMVEAAAITAGVFMLLGYGWARWLAMAWISFHVVISVFHPLEQLLVHVLVFAFFAFALFRRGSRDYFTARRAD